ncbi:hypothetical protein [Kitasatospora sp. NPDC101183]|uniref:hypothetical protein n=1 Tax=Kitasatospora sp. NPDC101183 TaxID=3364100 RepID=UPI00382B3CD0
MTTPEHDAGREPSVVEIARQWAKLDSGFLKVATAAVQPELKRVHLERMKELDNKQREREAVREAKERQAAREAKERQALREAHERQAAREAEERQAAREAQERQAERSHRLYMGGLVAGFVLCAGMLCGSVIEALNKQEVSAGILAGPTMIGVVALFVLRQRHSGSGQQQPDRASVPGQQPPSVPPAPVPTPELVEPR